MKSIHSFIRLIFIVFIFQTMLFAAKKPVIDSNGGERTATISIAENTISVTTVYADEENGNSVKYSLGALASSGDDDNKFTIDKNTGVLVFKVAPDYENPNDTGQNHTYEVIVKASDSVFTYKYDTQTITVTITDVDESSGNNPPVITSANDGYSVNENSTTVTPNISATDSDSEDTLTYSIPSGVDADKFNIDTSTGALSLKTAPDYENPDDSGTNGTYNITVSVSDGTEAVSADIAVGIVDVDENTPPVITSNSYSVNENSTTVTPNISATDNDSGDTLTYSILSGVDADKFNIDTSTGALSLKTAPDYENPDDDGTDRTYNITVSVSDGTEAVSADITVAIVDVDDTSPPVMDNGTSVSLSQAENVADVTTISATDAQNDSLTYHITGGADRNSFNLNSSTGALIFAVTPDFENPVDSGQNNTYEVTVKANDGTADSEIQTITVTITDDTSEVVQAPICVTADDALQTFEGAITLAGNVNVVNPDDTLPSSAVTNGANAGCNSSGLCVKDALVPAIQEAEVKSPDEIDSDYDFGSETKNISVTTSETINKVDSIELAANANYNITVGDEGNLELGDLTGNGNNLITVTKSSSYNMIIKDLPLSANGGFTASNVDSFKADNISLSGNSKFIINADKIDVKNNFIFNANGNFKINPTTSGQDVDVRIHNMEFLANGTIELASGDYYFDTLKIDANIEIKVIGSGPVRIFVNNMDASNSANLKINDNTKDPSKFLLYINDTGSFTANGDMYGVIASRGAYTLGVNSKLKGAIVAKSIDVEGNAQPIYDSQLSSLDLGDNILFCDASTVCKSDDLCYSKIETEGFNMMMIKMFYKITTTVKNNSGENLNDVTVSKTVNGMSFSTGDEIGINNSQKTLTADSDTAEQSSGISFGSQHNVSFFNNGTVYRLEDFSNQAEKSYYDKTMMEFSMASVAQVVEYTKNGSSCTIQLEACTDIVVPPPPVDFESCGAFPGALSTWDRVYPGNGDMLLNSPILYTNDTSTDIDCGTKGDNCDVAPMTIPKLTFPSFTNSLDSTSQTISTGTYSDMDYGNLIFAKDSTITLTPTTTYDGSSSKFMRIAKLGYADSDHKGPVTLNLNEGDYWIGSWNSGQKLTVNVNGPVRLFIAGDMMLNKNILHFNDGGLASNLYIFVYGDFDTTGNGGGSAFNLTSYMYIKGTMNESSHSSNQHFKGAFTSEGSITINNNQTFEYEPSGLDADGYGICEGSYDTCEFRPFTLRQTDSFAGTINIIGNVKVIGNTVQCVTSLQGDANNLVTPVRNGVCSNNTAHNNNGYYTTYVDVDSDSNTFNSSSSTLAIPIDADNENQVKIVWAGLYWQGKIYENSTSIKWKNGEDAPTDITSLSQNNYDTNTVQFKVAGSSAYQTVTAEQSDCYSGGTLGELYSNFADVTTKMPEFFNGDYTVANVQSTYGYESHLGNFGAWSLVVVYEDPTEKLRNISVFDGYKMVSHSQDYPEVSIPISGFLTPVNGDVNASLSIFASEGEYALSGDSLRLDNQTPAGVNSNNAFDASLSGIISTPQLDNTNGIDIDSYDVGNIMTNSQTSATIKLTSNEGGDSYFPSVVVFSTEMHKPRVCYFQKILNADGTEITGTVNIGTTLLIETLISNKREEGDTETSIEDAQKVKVSMFLDNDDLRYNQGTSDEGTLYLKNIGVENYVKMTDADTDDDLGSFNFDENKTKFNVGTDATSTEGGTIALDEEAYFKLKADITSESNTSITINNDYFVSYYDSIIDQNFYDVPMAKCRDMNETLNIINEDNSLCYTDVTSDNNCIRGNNDIFKAKVSGTTCQVTWTIQNINQDGNTVKLIDVTKAYNSIYDTGYTDGCGVDGVTGNCETNSGFDGATINSDYRNFIGGIKFDLPNMNVGDIHSIYTSNTYSADSATEIAPFAYYTMGGATYSVRVAPCLVTEELGTPGQFRAFDKGRLEATQTLPGERDGDINTHIVNQPFEVEIVSLNSDFTAEQNYTGVLKTQVWTKTSDLTAFEKLTSSDYRYIEFNSSRVEDSNYTFTQGYKNLKITLEAVTYNEGNVVDWENCKREIEGNTTAVDSFAGSSTDTSEFANVPLPSRDLNQGLFQVAFANAYFAANTGATQAQLTASKAYAKALYNNETTVNDGTSTTSTAVVDLNNSDDYNRCLQSLDIMPACMTRCAVEPYMKSDDCYDCMFESVPSANILSLDSDNFAVRPDRFTMVVERGGAPIIGDIFSGRNFNMHFRALDGNLSSENVVTNYIAKDVNDSFNKTFMFDYYDLNSSCITADFSQFSDNNFTAGELDILNVDYPEIGDVNFTIREPRENEGDCNASGFSNLGCFYAIVDYKDRNLSSDVVGSINPEQLYITPANRMFKFDIDHININATLYNFEFDTDSDGVADTDNGFTFLANDIVSQHANMDVNISAQNADNNITKNYTNGCYATGEGNITLAYSLNDSNGILGVPYLGSSGYLEQFRYGVVATGLLYEEDNATISGDSLSFDINSSAFIEGEASFQIKFNFNRQKHQAVVPFRLNVSDVNYSDDLYPDVTVNGGVDGNATFYYGRLHSPSRIGESPIEVKVDYEVFMPDGSTNDIANITDKLSSDSINWYVLDINKSLLAPSMGDSDAFRIPSSSPVTSTSLAVSGVPNSSNIFADFTYDGSKGFPYKDTIGIEADEWLLYDRYDPDATTNNFDLEFIGGATGWSGAGEAANTTVDDNVSKRTTRRLSHY